MKKSFFSILVFLLILSFAVPFPVISENVTKLEPVRRTIEDFICRYREFGQDRFEIFSFIDPNAELTNLEEFSIIETDKGYEFGFQTETHSIHGVADNTSRLIDSLVFEMDSSMYSVTESMGVEYALSPAKTPDEFSKLPKANPFDIREEEYYYGYLLVLSKKDMEPEKIISSKVMLVDSYTWVGERNVEKTNLLSGEYIVGQHIPAGEYSASTVAISVNLSTRRDGKLRINEVLSPTNPVGRMVLQDGDEIEISGGAVTFTPLK